jgi:serpin B
MMRSSSSWLVRLGTLALVLAFLSGCGPFSTPTPTFIPPNPPIPSQPTGTPPSAAGQSDQGQIVQSQLERLSATAVPQADLSALVQGNSDFAMALYQQLRNGSGNLSFSPFSISLALGMTYGGASNETAAQMAETLHYTLPEARLNPAMNLLDQTLASYAGAAGSPASTATPTSQGFQLDLANAIWGQAGISFLPVYLDLLAQDYGAGIHVANFELAPENARQVINQWVQQQTQGKITNLFPPGAIDTATRLVLANAIYFKAGWQDPFDPKSTQPGPFYLTNGSSVQVPMMNSGEETYYPYAQGDGYQAIELPYQTSPVVMLIVMPSSGTFSNFEAGLNDTQLNSILAGLNSQHVNLSLPKYKIESTFDLSSTLAAMGMKDAFNASQADFSGMDGRHDLYISDVMHKDYVSVDEQGTEAAAATGVAMSAAAVFNPASTLKITIDHPFLFFIVDSQTGTILFLGRVLNPAG